MWAVTHPGLEGVTAAELVSLGLTVHSQEPGGVAFRSSVRDLYRANLWLRTASRLVMRLGEFTARGFPELERHAKRIPWTRVLRAGAPVTLRVTCRKSRLYHSGAVAQRIGKVITDITGSPVDQSSQSEDAESDAQLIVVRMLHDVCTISADSSGALLHRRGYRLATAKAPLRETLGAAMLLASGWTGETPLVDPMCGSGTIAIEGALIARNLPPGMKRKFAFMRWPGFRTRVWESMVEEAEADSRPTAAVKILAADRDAGAVEAATSNAARAGVAADIQIERRAVSALEVPPGPGLLAINPPYGLRVGERDKLRDLYARLGDVVREKCPGWTLTLLSADAKLERQIGLPFETLARTQNGGIPVRLLRAEVPALPAHQGS
jgi:putative N6-adenine-specific DNA methylase